MTGFSAFEKNSKMNEKIHLQRVAKYAMQSVAKKAIPNERVALCLRRRLGDYVSVWSHRQTQKSFYNGLMVCGSVWGCPVCAAKVSEKRRLELKAAFDQWQQQGGKIAMLTLTFSHKRKDKLKDILSRFTASTTKFMTGKAYHNIRQEMGIVGRVRAFEVTYGANGFHPHVHIAIFHENETDLGDMEKRMYQLWSKACLKNGLTASKKHGLSLQDGNAANDYLSKYGTWSLEQEMSKAHIKVAKIDNMTPFDFLRKYLETGDEKMLKLFNEYFYCFKGRKQLQWSQGLKQMFDLEEKTDEELAKEKLEEADMLGLIGHEEWREIVKHELRGHLLNNIDLHGFYEGVLVTLEQKKSADDGTSTEQQKYDTN